MNIYLIKLILILVFNIGVNIYYIYPECKCCCGNSKSGEIGSESKGNLGTNPPKGHGSKGGCKHIDKFEIDLNNHTLKCNGNRLTEFKKIDEQLTDNPEKVINAGHNSDKNIYYTINKNIFNSIKEDSNVEIIKNSNSDTYIVFAVKTQVEKFEEGDQKYDYYLVYCHNGNNEEGYGLFEGIDTNVEIIILGSGNNLTDISSMFFGCKNLKKIIFTTKSLNTSNVTNMKGMFTNCESLHNLNLSNFDTINVTNMKDMFNRCESLTSLNVSKFNTSKVTNMDCMFSECNSLTSLDVSSFSTQNVTNMACMFHECNSLTSLNVSSFNTRNVTNMEGMFYKCNSLTSLNVSNFSTQNVINMKGMFYECSNLNNLDLSNFNTNNVTDMSFMFAGCTNLTSLILPNKVIYGDVTNSYGNMFDRCANLKGKVTTNDKNINNMYGQFIKNANK